MANTHLFTHFSAEKKPNIKVSCARDSRSELLIPILFSHLSSCIPPPRPPQIKATDNGRPQKSSTARLHIEWIRRPPAAVPLLFDQPLYNFTVMENDKVSEIVGVVSLQQSSATVWFDITGERSWRAGGVKV